MRVVVVVYQTCFPPTKAGGQERWLAAAFNDVTYTSEWKTFLVHTGLEQQQPPPQPVAIYNFPHSSDFRK